MDPKKVVVSGAASGIGEATAIRFAKEGWDVCLTDINDSKLRDVYNKLPQGKHMLYCCDYTHIPSIEKLAEQLQSTWGYVDSLVNCAGVFLPAKAVGSALEDWYAPLTCMISGAVNLTRLCVPLFNTSGRIVHITSIHGERAEDGSSSYAMAKAALNQYCRGLAVELAPQNVLVNAIAPGFVDTPMNWVDGVNVVENEWFHTNYIQEHHLPLKRLARPEEIAGVALFLCGEDASYITGQVITVDGGLTITF